MSAPGAQPLLSFEMNEMRPFECTSTDLASRALSEAHALAIMIGSAFQDSPETSTTNGAIINNALGGIARLIALAAFAGEQA